MTEKISTHVEGKSEKAGKTASRPDRRPHPSRGVSPLHDRVLSLQGTIGNHAVHRMIKNGGMDAPSLKKAILPDVPLGETNDRYEQAADRMADRVIGMGEPEGAGKRAADAFQNPDRRDLRKLAGLGSGKSLPPAGRNFFESRFGRDFSHVRVHSDRAAAAVAEAFQARAFTVGRDIVFGEGEYHSGSAGGRKLLAHELAHVVQQQSADSPSNIIQRKPGDKDDDRKVAYPIKVPRDVTTEEELDRYAEIMIFGKVMNLGWRVVGWDVAAFAREGRTVRYLYKASLVSEHGAKKEGEAIVPSSSNPAYDEAKGDARDALNSEIDRRYWDETGIPEGEAVKEGEQAKIDMWNVYRDEVMAEKQTLKKLPAEIKALMGGEASFKPQDYEQLLRIADKLKTFSPEDIAVYRMLSLRATDDLDLFEKSVGMFLARKAELKKAFEKYEAERKGKDPASMADAVEAAWTGFDTSKIGKMSEADQYDLARRQTWEVTEAQLEYMITHPGETGVDFVKTITLMNTGETFKGMGQDIAEAASGDAEAYARWAGGAGAGAKLSGWLLAVGGVLYVASWLTGVGELATIAVFMAAMLASTIVLSGAESELRIAAAGKAKTPEEFKAHVTKAAAARTNVIIMLGFLALALAIRFMAKTYFPETVAKISKTLARFREKVRIVGKLSKVKAEFATEMEGHRQKLVEAGESAKESAGKQAEALEQMSLEDFVDKLDKGSGDFFQEAAVQEGQKVPWKALSETPEGLKAIADYKAGLAEALRTQVPREIDAMLKEQVDAIDAMLEKVEKATIPDEFEQAIKDHETFLSEEEVARRGKAREEQMLKEKAEEAEKTLEQEIKRYELARQAAQELIAGAKAERDIVVADLTEAAGAQSGKMAGLDKAVKTESSLTRKISDRVRGRDVSRKGLEKAVKASAAKINDALRFTMILDPAAYVAKIQAVKAALEAKGYTFVKLWNGWTKSDGTYMGANATFKTPKGQEFELQFHTEETFRIKTETHHIYEEARSRTVTDAQKAALDQQQRDAYRGIDVPPDVEALDKL